MMHAIKSIKTVFQFEVECIQRMANRFAQVNRLPRNVRINKLIQICPHPFSESIKFKRYLHVNVLLNVHIHYITMTTITHSKDYVNALFVSVQIVYMY